MSFWYNVPFYIYINILILKIKNKTINKRLFFRQIQACVKAYRSYAALFSFWFPVIPLSLFPLEWSSSFFPQFSKGLVKWGLYNTECWCLDISSFTWYKHCHFSTRYPHTDTHLFLDLSVLNILCLWYMCIYWHNEIIQIIPKHY